MAGCSITHKGLPFSIQDIVDEVNSIPRLMTEDYEAAIAAANRATAMLAIHNKFYLSQHHNYQNIKRVIS